MARLEELTLLVIDGVATPAELAEWERLVADTPDAERTVADLVAFEGTLLSAHFPDGLAERVMSRLRADRPEALRAATMARVRAAARRRHPRHLSGGPLRFMLPLLVGAAATVAFFVLRASPQPVDVDTVIDAPRAAVEPPAPSALARVAALRAGDDAVGPRATLVRDGAESPLADGSELVAADRIRVDACSVALEFLPDTARVETVGASTLVLAAGVPNRRVELERGSLNASLPPQRAGTSFVFATPLAEARVVGTTLALSTDRTTSRLEVGHGSVAFRNLRGGDPVLVGGGSYAVATSDGSLRTRPLARVVDDFEGGLLWQREPWSDAFDFGLADDPAGARGSCLRIEYRFVPPASGGNGYTAMAAPLSIQRDDAWLTFRLRVDRVEGHAALNVLLTMRDASCWYAGYIGLGERAGAGWRPARVRVDRAQKKNNAKGSDTYDPARVRDCIIGVHGGTATVYLDDVSLSAESMLTRDE